MLLANFNSTALVCHFCWGTLLQYKERLVRTHGFRFLAYVYDCRFLCEHFRLLVVDKSQFQSITDSECVERKLNGVCWDKLVIYANVVSQASL